MQPQNRLLRAVSSRGGLAISLLAFVIAAAGWVWLWRNPTPIPTPPAPPLPKIRTPVDTQELYRIEIEPLLNATQRANEQAMDRMAERIRAAINRYRSGIPAFADEMTSYRTRFNILYRMPSDWWNDDHGVKSYVQWKFRTHLLSERTLENDIESALKQLREDLVANRNRLLVDCKAAIARDNLPEIALPEFDAFDAEVSAMLVAFSSRHGEDSVYKGLATLITSETASQIAVQIVARVLPVVATSIAGSVTAATGTTVAATSTGGAGGTAVGPAGTIIGAGIGLVVGVAIDWWLTEEFQEKLVKDLNTYFDLLENHILDGTNEKPGLIPSLNRAIEDMNYAQAKVIGRAVVGAAQ